MDGNGSHPSYTSLLHLLNLLVPDWMVSGLVSVIVQLSSAWLAWFIGLLLVVWRYREFFMRSILSKGVVSVIYESQLRKQQEFSFPFAQKIIDAALRGTAGVKVLSVVLVLEGNHNSPTDICSAYELAVYVREMARKKDIPVMSFLRSSVTTSGYILACGSSAISIDPTTQLRLSCSVGVEELVKNLRPQLGDSLRTLVEGTTTEKLFVGREALQIGLVDRVGSYMEFILTQMQAEPVSIDESQLYGFVESNSDRRNRPTNV